MATEKEVEALLSKLDDATNAVASKLDAEAAQIKALQDQIAGGTPVTQEQLDGIATHLTAASERLTALAADPANPVPPVA